MTVTVQWLPRLGQPRPLKIGGLFYGYGGLDIAVQQVIPNTELAWYAEFDKGASKIGAHHHPDVPNHGDVTAIDWAAVEPVDILTGGSPCQDLSHAGKRAGMTEGTRSNLWVAMREAIAVIRPQLVVWENVRGAYSACADSEMGRCPRCVDPGAPGGHDPRLRALGRVVGDLADLGYDARWVGLPASRVGAPHGRFRVFLVASPSGFAADTYRVRGHEAVEHDGSRTPGGDGRGVPHERDREPVWAGPDGDLTLLKTPTSQLAVNGGSQHPEKRKAGGHGPTLADEVEHLLPTPRTKNNENRQSEQYAGENGNFYGLLHNPERWGDYAPAIARWETVLNRPAPEPTQLSSKGNPQLAARFVEWMMGLPPGHVTDVPGITRNEALKALGNGVVPQQAAAALRVLLAP